MPRPIAFEDVFRAHLDYVWRVARGLVGDAAADDVAQETFMIVRRRLSAFEGPSMRGWLYVITRNVARNRQRSRRRYRNALSLVSAPESPPDLDEAIEQREAAALLDHFVARLSPKKREAFVLHYLEGLPAKEISEALNVPIQTVYSRARAAREAFDRFVARQHAREVDSHERR